MLRLSLVILAVVACAVAQINDEPIGPLSSGCYIEGPYLCTRESTLDTFSLSFQQGELGASFGRDCHMVGDYSFVNDVFNYIVTECEENSVGTCAEAGVTCNVGFTGADQVTGSTDANSNSICEAWTGVDDAGTYICALTEPDYSFSGAPAVHVGVLASIMAAVVAVFM